MWRDWWERVETEARKRVIEQKWIFLFIIIYYITGVIVIYKDPIRNG
jgi:hypothetical protein